MEVQKDEQDEEEKLDEEQDGKKQDETEDEDEQKGEQDEFERRDRYEDDRKTKRKPLRLRFRSRGSAGAAAPRRPRPPKLAGAHILPTEPPIRRWRSRSPTARPQQASAPPHRRSSCGTPGSSSPRRRAPGPGCAAWARRWPPSWCPARSSQAPSVGVLCVGLLSQFRLLPRPGQPPLPLLRGMVRELRNSPLEPAKLPRVPA